MAELVDAHASGACAVRREGSSPSSGTNQQALWQAGAHGSGPCDSNIVEVRVLSRPQYY